MFFILAPQARMSRVGRCSRIGTASSCAPRRSSRGRPSITRAITESSTRVTISRLCSREKSARRGAGQAPSVIARADRFVAEVAAGHDGARPAARPGAGGGAACRRASPRECPTPAPPPGQSSRGEPVEQHDGVLGRGSSSASAGDTRQSRLAAAKSATITASGLPGRCLRARRRSTAAVEPASTARWKPPSPLMATTAPAARPRPPRSGDRRQAAVRPRRAS